MKWEKNGTYSAGKKDKELPAYTEQKTSGAAPNPKPYMEDSPGKMNLSILQNNLENCLSIIEDEVMKGYVTRLEQMPIIERNSRVFEGLQDIHFFHISELVYQEDEFSVDKLAMVFHALSNHPCTLVLMLKSDGEKTDFYLGARPNSSKSAGTLFQMLKQTLRGFFPGSRISEYYDEDMRRDMKALDIGCISSVTCVADYKQEQAAADNNDFIQGLEKFVYAMHGKGYTAILIADSLTQEALADRKREYEYIYTQISPFANMQMSFTESEGSSRSDGSSQGRTENVTVTTTDGETETETDTYNRSVGRNETMGTSRTYTDMHGQTVSEADGTVHTEGQADGTSHTETEGRSTGMYAGAAVNGGADIGLFKAGAAINGGISKGRSHSVAEGVTHTDSVSDSISKTLTHGFSNSYGFSNSESTAHGRSETIGRSQSMGRSRSESHAYAEGQAFNFMETKAVTDTFGDSKGITLNAQNMTLSLALQRIGKHLERMEECESFGMWNFAAYFLGETAAETETAANTYKSVIAGVDSGIERNAINSWSEDKSVKDMLPYLQNFVHPQFICQRFGYEAEKYMEVNPSALVSTKELAIHMGLPRHSVRGLPVVEHAPFAQEIIVRGKRGEATVPMGKVHHLGQDTDTSVELDLDSLTMHTFVTGSTGTGKSNAVYHLLEEVRRKKVPFLVVEPAKGEYKEIFSDVRCFGTNPKMGKMLRINPFSFPDGIHVLEHIDRIVEIFNVCWPMYAAMPAVLKESIEQAYISAGWDLDLSENRKVAGLFPTFDDVLRELQAVIRRSDYSADTKGDYIGSLTTRLKSLTNGINGRIFVSDEIDVRALFDECAIIDISRVGATETKALIMGLTVLKMQEYRIAETDGMNMPLRHVTVLEEAHNLLKKTSAEQTAESSNLAGKSVEMLANAIAEMRTYGEGFIIVDQAPNLLDTAVIRNTNTKIVLRLPESTDREIIGGSIALKNRQFDELSKLPRGIAAIYQNDWQEAVLCSLPKHADPVWGSRRREEYHGLTARKDYNDSLLHLLLKKELKEEEYAVVAEKIKRCHASAKIRKDLMLNLKRKNRQFEWALADLIQKNYDLRDVFRGTGNCENLEQVGSIMLQNVEGMFEGFTEQELYVIMYHICRSEHEKHPENQVIELLRVNYLKEKVM